MARRTATRPGTRADTEQMADYYFVRHRNSVFAAVVLLGAAAMALLWFAAQEQRCGCAKLVPVADDKVLRLRLVRAKRQYEDAVRLNDDAWRRGRPQLFDEATVDWLRMAVEIAALEARKAGVNIDDLAGPEFGRFDSPD